MNVWKNPRPLLVVEQTGGGSLGNCYTQTLYTVTSTRELKQQDLLVLRSIGMLGYGQEFRVCSSEVHTEMIDCVDDSTGLSAVNAYSGKFVEPLPMKYFVYKCEDRCDSSD